MSDQPDSPAARIDDLRRMLPPKEGRRSRLGYISKDDLADLIGAGRSTVMNWTKGKTYPENGYRIKLAELSGGRYQPEDFAPPTQAQLQDLRARLEALEALTRGFAPQLKRLGPALDALDDRVTAVEKQSQPKRRQKT